MTTQVLDTTTVPQTREEAPLRGLHASIFTNPTFLGCSNDGISSRCTAVTIVGTQDRRPGQRGPVLPLRTDSQVFEPDSTAPAVIVVYRHFGGQRLVSVEPLDSNGWNYMAGGSYVATSDSRFGDLIGFYGAVSLHDRYEG